MADGGPLSIGIGVTLARLEREMAKVLKVVSQGARQAENEWISTNEKVGSSAETLSKKLDMAFGVGSKRSIKSGDFAELARVLNATAGAVDPTVAAMERYKAELTNLNTLLTNGAISQEQHAAATQRAKFAYDNMMSSIDAANAAMERQIGIRSRIEQNLGIGAGENYDTRAADIAAYASELDRLRSKYDPLFAASKKYESELDQLNNALSVGAINADTHAAALSKLNAQYSSLADESANSVASQTRAMNDLRASIDPLYATSKQYEAQLMKINNARKLGVISANQEAVAIEQLNATYTTAGLQQANIVERSMKRSGFATANLAAQINDVGVSLAGGQSPFLVMVQQGTQISQIFAQTGASVSGFATLLKGAIGSVLNPFSLATFAAIGLTGVVVQYFMKLSEGSDDAESDLKKQADLIESVADRWEEAVPSLAKYVAEVKRLKEQSDLQSAVQYRITEIFRKFSEQLPSIEEQMVSLVATMMELSDFDKEAADIYKAFEELKKKIDDGTASADDLKKVQDLLAAAFQQTGIPAIDAMIERLAGLTVSFGEAANAAAILRGESAAAENYGAEMKVASLNYGRLQNEYGSGADAAQREALRNLPDTIGSRVRSGSGGAFKAPRTRSGSKGPQDFTNEVAAVKERTASLVAMTAAQAALNPLVEDYGYAIEKVKVEQKLLADAQKQGLAITPELREKISDLAEGYAQASAAAKKLAEDQDEIKKRAEEFEDLSKDVMGGFIKDLRDGKSASEALANALNKVADKLLDMALDSLFTGGGRGGGNFLSGIGSALSFLFGGFRGFASGTANTGGRPGEPRGIVHGREAVIPLPAGGKVPVQVQEPQMPVFQPTQTGGEISVAVTTKVENGELVPLITAVSGQVAGQQIKMVNKSMPQRLATVQGRNR